MAHLALKDNSVNSLYIVDLFKRQEVGSENLMIKKNCSECAPNLLENYSVVSAIIKINDG